jgi:O-antigen/teichoic acid export membrane protein
VQRAARDEPKVLDQPVSLRTTVVRGAASAMVIRVASTGVGLAAALILARALGPAQYGTYAWAFTLVSALALPAMLGTDQLLVRDVAVERSSGNLAGARAIVAGAQRLVLAASLLLALACVLVIVVWGPEHDRPRALAIGLPMLPFIAAVGIQQGALQGLQRVTAALVPGTLLRQAAFVLFVAVAALALGESFSAEWAVALQGVASLGGWAVGAVLLRRALPRGGGVVGFRTLLRSGSVAMGMSAGVLALDSQVGLLVLGAGHSAREAGIYAVATSVTAVFSVLLFAMRTPLAPVLARLHSGEEPERLARAVAGATRGVFALSMLAALPLLVIPDTVLSIFGSGFEHGAGALRLLAVANLINAFAAFNGLLLMMTGHERSAARASAWGLALNVVLCLALVPPVGAEGAAAAYLASVALRNLLNTAQARRLLGLDPTLLARP